MMMFSLVSLKPIIVLLAISAFIPVVLSILKLKFIPVFVIEIIAGMVIGEFFNQNGYFNTDLMDGFYTIGMAFLLFLSGLETDFDVLRKSRKDDGFNINPFKVSLILLILVILISILSSFLFYEFIEKGHKLEGIILLALWLSSTFASIVVPIVHEKGSAKTSIGQIIATYATLSELLAIVVLSAFMIINKINEQNPWLLLVLCGILLITYLLKRIVPSKIFANVMEGIVHLGIRLILLVFLVLVIISETAGAEFILGAFLAGMVIRASKPSPKTVEKIEVIGYGIFVPMFYILVGVRIPIFELFTTPKYIMIILILTAMLIIVKIPFLLLYRWYHSGTVIPTMFLATCTIIVAIAMEHLNVFESEFVSCMIVASSLTCLIPPIIFEANTKFDVAKEKYKDVILETHEVQ